MSKLSNMSRMWVIASTLLIALLLNGCASSGPDIRSNYDRSVDFRAYHSFGFVEEPGTNRAGYSSLITQYFKNAARREMEALGYRYSEDNPDLLVNFFTNIRNESDVRGRSGPRIGLGYGYYGYRYGMYSAWPLYGHDMGDDVTTVHYRVGTANIDVIDAAKNQMIWEGMVEGRLPADAESRSEEIINTVVTDVFKQYPLATGAVDSQ